MSQEIKIRQEDGVLRKIGFVKDDKFYSIREKSVHLFRKLNAWGIDYKAFVGIQEQFGVRKVIIIDTENGFEYEQDVGVIEEFGEKLNFKPHRTQIFLPLKHWQKRKRIA